MTKLIKIAGLIVAASFGATASFSQPPAEATAAPAPQPFGQDAAPVDGATLDRVHGRADLNQVAQAEHVASVKDSSVSGNSVTGGVAIDGNAFQNLSGLSIVNANTGNNVAINASMNVNIAILTPQ